jgi:natural product biosynthesis luciferase-like monooxygenase protein
MELIPAVEAAAVERVLRMQIQAFNQLVAQQLQMLDARSAAPALPVAAPGPSVDALAAPSSSIPPSTPQPVVAAPTGRRTAEPRSVRFSLAFSSQHATELSIRRYDLLFDIARFADHHGFNSLWIPESHFHSSGGLSSNPSVLAAALARETERVALRAGSVLLPLHHPVRVAEEWSLVDNLSGGRVGLAFAAVQHREDFTLTTGTRGSHRELMLEQAETVRRLWKGETIRLRDGAGTEVDLGIFPLPARRDLPIWIRADNDPETCRLAGEMGAGVLTDLTEQTPEELPTWPSTARLWRAPATRRRRGMQPCCSAHRR